MPIRIEVLSEANFADYERLTSCESGGGCYCAFWHGKWSSIADWDERKKTNPFENRELIRSKLRNGFHVGVLAYENEKLVAWISVSPLPEVYWTWKRVAQLQELAGHVAGITCITISPEFRSQKRQAEVLRALVDYGKLQKWSAIEGYPFDESAYQKHGRAVAWPGKASGFAEAGFLNVGPHWLSQAGAERSIYRHDLQA